MLRRHAGTGIDCEFSLTYLPTVYLYTVNGTWRKAMSVLKQKPTVEIILLAPGALGSR